MYFENSLHWKPFNKLHLKTRIKENYVRNSKGLNMEFSFVSLLKQKV